MISKFENSQNNIIGSTDAGNINKNKSSNLVKKDTNGSFKSN